MVISGEMNVEISIDKILNVYDGVAPHLGLALPEGLVHTYAQCKIHCMFTITFPFHSAQDRALARLTACR